MAKYRHTKSNKVVDMSKDTFKKLPESVQVRYVEIPSATKKKKATPPEADEQTD